MSSTLEQIEALFPSPPLTLTIEQIAEVIGVARQTIYNQLSLGKCSLPLNGRGGRRTALKSHIAAWLDGTLPDAKPPKRGRPKNSERLRFCRLLVKEIDQLWQRELRLEEARQKEQYDQLKEVLHGQIPSLPEYTKPTL
ncbi:helix-turn-helix domain-containing protein [Ferriphaselus sp. R-1]|uniref:helix-turn-helix transcriptional regulator n=1 Tax=Ferriphaselus sp. R-1 TaxID=1485544 RepID=UPI0012694E29|nr:helix-turn-helix domain-containing protein [Ferriphaselus sp. R-1]